VRKRPHRAGLPIAAAAAVGALGAASAGTPQVPTRHAVEMRGIGFHPDTLRVARGDTVVWINRDIVPHTATSSRKSDWNTGTIAQGDSGRYVAGRKGTESYSCLLHPTMRGILIVR
jgi:plastocyanin